MSLNNLKSHPDTVSTHNSRWDLDNQLGASSRLRPQDPGVPVDLRPKPWGIKSSSGVMQTCIYKHIPTPYRAAVHLFDI